MRLSTLGYDRLFSAGYTQTQCDYGKASHEYPLGTCLKERLRETSGEHGYQTCIQAVLWQFVEQLMGSGGGRSMPLELWRFCDGAATSVPNQQHGLS